MRKSGWFAPYIPTDKIL